jgi:ATP-dependent Lon protease
MDEPLLPLFPLEIVLMPEAPLPLHIFEERYKEMIGECLKAAKDPPRTEDFGVVLAKGQEVSRLGCSARIVNVTRTYDDGRMDIFTVGARRFEILVVNEDRNFLRGGVQFFDDDPGADLPTEADATRAIELFRQMIERIRRSKDIPIHLLRPYRHLSFRLTSPLGLDLDFKQLLLGVRNETERLSQVIQAFEKLLPELDRAQRAREKAGGNGHSGSAHSP